MKTVQLSELPGLVGQEIGVSDWVEITQERVNKFAEATGDFQWIHVDVDRARAAFGGTIAHGYLVLSMIPLLRSTVMEVEGVSRGINYGGEKLRFTSFLPVGKRIRLRLKLLSCEPKAGGLLLADECTIEIEGADKPACVTQTLALLYA